MRNIKWSSLRRRKKKQKRRNIVIKNKGANGLNDPIKKHKVARWIRKQNPYICYKRPTLEQKI